MGSCRVSMLFATTFFALAVFAQSSTGQNPVKQGGSPDGVKPVRIQAYTAEFKSVNVQTLANGTTITTETKEVRAKDSQNRNLFVTTRTPPAAGIEMTNGTVDNPVENTRIMWDSHSKKASIIRLPPQDQRHGCWASDSHHLTIHYGGDLPPRSAIASGGAGAGLTMTSVQLSETSHVEQTHEDLGMATIQGLEATGTRSTSVIPAGKMGNDSPITTTQESWRAPGFPFALREIYDDPRTGKRTREVVSLTIGEPDLSLFQPPEGYEVVNEEMHEVPCQQ